MLAINESLKEIINFQTITAFRQNQNLKELIESDNTEKNKVKKRQIWKLKPGKCSPCLTNVRSLCCKQVQKTATFKNQRKKYIYIYIYIYIKDIPQHRWCQQLCYIFDRVHFM